MRARWLDPNGERHQAVRSGWRARILQHEVDHLNGILYVDRVFTRSAHDHQLLGLVSRPLAEVRAAFGLG